MRLRRHYSTPTDWRLEAESGVNDEFSRSLFPYWGEQFGFLVYDELVRQVYADDLYYAIANCIAVWTTR